MSLFNLREIIHLLERLESRVGDGKFVVYFSSGPVDYSDVIDLYDTLSLHRELQTLYLLLDSPGGNADAAFKIVSILRQCSKNLISVVPFSAKSAATLITLGADEIQMGPVSELGPIDPQIMVPGHRSYSVHAVRESIDFLSNRLKEEKDPELLKSMLQPILDKLDPLILGDMERAIKASKQYATHLLQSNMLRGESEEKIKGVVEKLSEGYYSHTFVIDRNEARSMGLNVKFLDGDYWQDVWSLFYALHRDRIDSGDDDYLRIGTLDSFRDDYEMLEEKAAEADRDS